LKKLNYYSGEIDGLKGPKTKEAIIDFESDFGLIETKYNFRNSEKKNFIQIEITNGDDFLNYWGKRKMNNSLECSSSMCISNDKIVISTNCAGIEIGVSTKSEVTLSASIGQNKYETTFNKEKTKDSCSINWKVCLSKDPNVSINICNFSLIATSGGKLKLSATRGNQTKNINLL